MRCSCDIFGHCEYWLIPVALCCLAYIEYHLDATTPRVAGGAHPSKATPSEKLSIFDPRFNLREIAKQLTLLEDHLFHENKHCRDCISKHYLTIEGFMEEAVTLDKNREHEDEIAALQKIRRLVPPLITKIKDKTAQQADYLRVAHELRQLRKPLAVKYADMI